jgi:hypothetical protein
MFTAWWFDNPERKINYTIGLVNRQNSDVVLFGDIVNTDA